MTERKAVFFPDVGNGYGEAGAGEVDQPERSFTAQPPDNVVDQAVIMVKNPAGGGGDHDRGHGPRQQIDGARQVSHAEVLVEQFGDGQPEHDLQDNGCNREEESKGEGGVHVGVAGQRDIVVEADKVEGAAHGAVIEEADVEGAQEGIDGGEEPP